MNGNVPEWVFDSHDSYPAVYISNPAGPPEDNQRVARGSFYNGSPEDCRVTFRAGIRPHSDTRITGFRIARSAPWYIRALSLF